MNPDMSNRLAVAETLALAQWDTARRILYGSGEIDGGKDSMILALMQVLATNYAAEVISDTIAASINSLELPS